MRPAAAAVVAAAPAAAGTRSRTKGSARPAAANGLQVEVAPSCRSSGPEPPGVVAKHDWGRRGALDAELRGDPRARAAAIAPRSRRTRSPRAARAEPRRSQAAPRTATAARPFLIQSDSAAAARWWVPATVSNGQGVARPSRRPSRPDDRASVLSQALLGGTEIGGDFSATVRRGASRPRRSATWQPCSASGRRPTLPRATTLPGSQSCRSTPSAGTMMIGSGSGARSGTRAASTPTPRARAQRLHPPGSAALVRFHPRSVVNSGSWTTGCRGSSS